MDMGSIELEAMVTEELEYRLRQAKKVSLGTAKDIDLESVSKLNERLAPKGIEIVHEGGYVYAIERGRR